MADLGERKHIAPVIPPPQAIRVERRYWGRLLSSWAITAQGEVTFIPHGQDEGAAQQAEGTPADFSRVRAIFQPYESRHFRCSRIIADLPYGEVIWMDEAGAETQRTPFDEGCVTGDAADLFARLLQADGIIEGLMGADQ